MPDIASQVRLDVQLGRLRLANPIMVASGTFGYAREMAGLVDLGRLGGIVPKTITWLPREGNPPPRTVETAAGMLNSIGLDNDGVEAFIGRLLPYLAELAGRTTSDDILGATAGLSSSANHTSRNNTAGQASSGTRPYKKGPAVVVSIAGKSVEEFIRLAERLQDAPPPPPPPPEGIDALELNVSCPNVSGGTDFGADPSLCGQVVAGVRGACSYPILAKLTPNVNNVAAIARAAADAGADALSLINTCLGMAVDWRRRRPILGNVMGGLSGPAIKPIALRIVYQVARAVDIPLIGIGGIATIDDVMEFLVCGASAVQIGTANFYDPTVTMRIIDALPNALAELGAKSVEEVVGTVGK